MANETPAEKKETRRVVLKREQVLVLAPGVTLEQIAKCADEKALRRLLVSRAESPPRFVMEAWVWIGEFSGAAKDDAIRSYAGEPGTPDAKVGDYKAPGVTAWKGGLRFVAPPKPLVQAEAIE